MALATYDDLKNSIALWLGRVADAEITSAAADFIALAEAYINRNLRVRQMETVQTFTTTDGSTNVADDYLAWKRLTWMGDVQQSLEYVIPDLLHRMHPTADAGIPTIFTIEGSNIIVRATDDDTSYEFLYYAKVPALASDNTTNWLLTEYPDLYLSASLAEANAFIINPDHAAKWVEKRDTIIASIVELSEKTKGPSRVQPIGTFY